jgi:hypothetical protein
MCHQGDRDECGVTPYDLAYSIYIRSSQFYLLKGQSVMRTYLVNVPPFFAIGRMSEVDEYWPDIES